MHKSSCRVHRVLGLSLLTGLVAAASACSHVPLQARAEVRLARYFSVPRELPPSILDAMRRGHVVPGMDQEQVAVVLGSPVRQTHVDGTRPVDIWIYRWERLHQDHVHSSGTLYRLVFIDGRLVLIESI